jgi:hypothetical protein
LSGQNHDAELVNYETNISVKNGKLSKTEKYEIKIYNRAGEKYTKITIPYSKLIKVSDIEAFIKDDNGKTIKALKSNEITNKSAISSFSLYEDDFIKEFVLKHNIYPYSLCYSYEEQQEEFFYIDSWQPVIDINVPTLRAVLNVETPPGYKISFTSQLIDNFQSDTLDTQIRYTWTASYRNLIKSEPYSPPVGNFFPTVLIVPVEYKYGLNGSQKNWLDYGNWYYDIIQGLSDLPQSEKNNIISIIAGINDTRGKIKKLYHSLQDGVRYINVTIGTGGLKPYPASYVAQNKYGDCKALSNYFKSVLDFAGIKSYYSLVRAGDPVRKVNKSFPSQQFNHVILCVPLQEDTIWLDCTSKMPFNYLGTFIQSRDVFIIDKNLSHFTRIPSLSADDVLEIRKINVSQNPAKTVTGTINNTYKGNKYETLYYISHNYNESQKSQIIRNGLLEEGFEVIDYKLTEKGRDSKEIQLFCTVKLNKVYNNYGNEILINLLPVSLPNFEEPKTRKLPVQFDYPIHKIDTLEYLIPDGFYLSGTLNNKFISSEFGSYTIEFTQKDKMVRVIRNFLLNTGYYTSEKYKAFYSFISEIKETENNTYIVTSKRN